MMSPFTVRWALKNNPLPCTYNTINFFKYLSWIESIEVRVKIGDFHLVTSHFYKSILPTDRLSISTNIIIMHV